MIFTRIGRSVSRSSRFGNLLNGRGRSAGLIGNGGISGVPRCGSYLGPVDGELRFLRSYFAASIAAHKARVSDFSCILANPKLCLHFSSETPKKKNSENFHPKEKKEIPKEDDQKTKPKDESKTDNQEFFLRHAPNLTILLSAIMILLSILLIYVVKQIEVSNSAYVSLSYMAGPKPG
ncbi:hypothetical protein ACFX10_029273 [Malus domestica]